MRAPVLLPPAVYWRLRYLQSEIGRITSDAKWQVRRAEAVYRDALSAAGVPPDGEFDLDQDAPVERPPEPGV